MVVSLLVTVHPASCARAYFSGLHNQHADIRASASPWRPLPNHICYMKAESFFYTKQIKIKEGKNFIILSDAGKTKLSCYSCISQQSFPSPWTVLKLKLAQIVVRTPTYENIPSKWLYILWEQTVTRYRKVDQTNLPSHVNSFQIRLGFLHEKQSTSSQSLSFRRRKRCIEITNF